jgi:hypothetical protein
VVTSVKCYDSLAGVQRTYVGAKNIVLFTGTVEATKIALQSQIHPNNKVGQGVTDHTILYQHFRIPPQNITRIAATTDSEPRSTKVLMRHPAQSLTEHAFDVIIEFGAEFNQGRYVDSKHLNDDKILNGGYLVCEIIFRLYAPLIDGNHIILQRDQPIDRPRINMLPVPSSAITANNNLVDEAVTIATEIL